MSKKAMVLWFTGLSGSGKSTLAKSAQIKLAQMNQKVLILDGDEIRDEGHKHLGFTQKDIMENNKLVTNLCLDHINDYDVIMVPIISPYIAARESARNKIGNNFFEIYIKASLSKLEERDTKGLYRKQKLGLIDNLIGVSPNNVYEEPISPDLIMETDLASSKKCTLQLIKFIEERKD